MQRVTPRLMLAHSGAGSRQSQHWALPSTLCTWAATCPTPPGSLPLVNPPGPSVAEELMARCPEPWGEQGKKEWLRGKGCPSSLGSPALHCRLRYLPWTPGAVIKASLAEGCGDAALHGADPQLHEAL